MDMFEVKLPVNDENENAKENEEKLYYAAQEDKQSRLKRNMTWQVLVSSISCVPKTVYEHIHVGNVRALYMLIKTHYAAPDLRDRKVATVDKMQSSKMVKRSSESFAQYVSKWRALLSKAKELKIAIDPQLKLKYVVRSLYKSSCPHVMKALAIVTANGKATSPENLFQRMEAVMEALEGHKRYICQET